MVAHNVELGRRACEDGSSHSSIAWAINRGGECVRFYVAGLIGPGDRKSVQPMAERLAPGDYDQLHHFVAAGVWDAAPLETELLIQADRLVGGSDAVLVIDDTAVPKKGTHSVGVAAQYASALGQARQLPNSGVTNARPRRSSGDGGIAAFSSR